MSSGYQDLSRGRPRDPARTEQILQAAQIVLVEVGYDRLSIDTVAERSRVGKATIYRRWPSKAALVADAVNALHPIEELPDTGSLRDDLMALAVAFTGSRTRDSVVTALITAMSRDQQLRNAIGTAVAAPRTAEFTAVIQRAIARGEADPSADPSLLGQIVPSMVFHQVAVHGHVTDVFVTSIVDHILLPLVAPALRAS